MGAAALNKLSVAALSYPALLVTEPYEIAAVLSRAAREPKETTDGVDPSAT